MAEEKSQDKSDTISMGAMAALLPTFFKKAYTIYGQDIGNKGNFYISDGNLLGLKMAVLPERDTFVFSTYCPASMDDCDKLRRLNLQNIFKTYDCALCAIQEPNNAILVSDEQNQFYVDKKAASVQLNQQWEGESNMRFVVSGTVPQYYKGHLLLTASNHTPMFAVFTDTRVLKNILLFMQSGSKVIGEGKSRRLYSYMNGNSGSDPWHFHCHITVHNDPFLQRCIEDSRGHQGVKATTRGIVRALVFSHPDMDSLVNIVFNNMPQILPLRNLGFSITSNFFFADNKFFVVVYVTKGDRNIHYTSPTGQKKCLFILIPAACMLFPTECFQAPRNKRELDHFLSWVQKSFGQMYVKPNNWGLKPLLEKDGTLITRNHWGAALKAIIDLSPIDILETPGPEALYVWTEHKRYPLLKRANSGDKEAKDALLKLGVNATQWCIENDCFITEDKCSPEERSKFKYMLGLGINNISQAILDSPSPKLMGLLINAEFARLRTLNYNGMVTTDYMYFQGSYIQHIIKRTIGDLLTVTSGAPKFGNPDIGPWIEKGEILQWFVHNFKQIGEPSVSGTNTISEIQFPIPGRDCRTTLNPAPCNKIDMIMKIMDTRKKVLYTGPDCRIQTRSPVLFGGRLPSGWSKSTNDNLKEFIHEFFASMIINDVRKIIPNFSLCYGGFFCDSSNFKILCDMGAGTNTSYLLMELVKDAETLGRAIQTPTRDLIAEAQEFMNGITQVVVALSYAWHMKKFTHYDLHVNNVMRYNILSTNFSKLFKGVDIAAKDIPDSVLFRYWGGSDILGKASRKPGGEGSILIPATQLYLIIDYGNSYVEGMPHGTHYERCDRVSVGMTPTRSKSYFDVFTLAMNSFTFILREKLRMLISLTANSLRDIPLVHFFRKFFSAYKEVWNVKWEMVMPGAAQTVIANRDLRRYFMSVTKSKYRSEYTHYLSPRFDPKHLPADFNSPVTVLNWIMTTMYNPVNYWKHLDTSIVFNWGNVPSDRRPGIQPLPSVIEKIDTTIQKKKKLANITRNFMKSYTKYKQEEWNKKQSGPAPGGWDPMDTSR